MAALVADYGDSSSSEAEPEVEEDSNKVYSSEGENLTSTKSVESGINFLTGDSVGSGSSDSEDDDTAKKESGEEMESAAAKLPNPLAGIPAKLPPPSLEAGKAGKAVIGSASVFVNPFQKAEEAKHSILEQHVKMTASAPQSKEKSGKKVCWNFRKGKCRFGHKCKYAHDNDINTLESDIAVTDPNSQQNLSTTHYRVGHWPDQMAEPEPEDEDSYMAQSKRKRRAGVRDGLVPPKKAVQALEKQRAQERPWTMNK